MSDVNQTDPDVQWQAEQPAAARSEAEVREFVRNLILELAPAPEGRTAPNPRLVEDLGYHSLALMELAFALEDEFGLQTIDEETARTIVTIGDVENHVLGELASGGRPAGVN